MNYFIISQDISLLHTVIIENTSIPEPWKKELERKRSVEFEHGKLVSRNHNFLIKSNPENVYPDLLEAPLPLLSTQLKDVFCSFEDRIQCNCAILSDSVLRRQEVYWLFALERTSCLRKATEFYPNGTLKKIVLSENAIGDRCVFRIGGIIETAIVIRYDVAESILRRPITGVRLKEIDLEP